MKELKKILVGIDYSEYSREAARYAVYLAKALDASVCFLHVSEMQAYIGSGMGPFGSESIKNHLTKEQLKKDKYLSEMKRFVGEFEKEDIEISYLAALGNAPAEIIRIAEETSADMIVLGTHGRKGISQLILGSVAEKVVRKAPCPVLTIKLADQSLTV